MGKANPYRNKDGTLDPEIDGYLGKRTDKEMGDILGGFAKQSVTGWRKERGIISKRERDTLERYRKIVAGAPWPNVAECARRIGANKSSVQILVERRGLQWAFQGKRYKGPDIRKKIRGMLDAMMSVDEIKKIMKYKSRRTVYYHLEKIKEEDKKDGHE